MNEDNIKRLYKVIQGIAANNGLEIDDLMQALEVVLASIVKDIAGSGGGGGEVTEVIDNLTSNDINKALSANQGRVLNEKKVDEITGDGAFIREKGKWVSSNPFTDNEKDKLETLTDSPFRGKYTSLEELEKAISNPEPGNYAYVDEGAGKDIVEYLWDDTDSKWVLQLGASTAETPESIAEKYESVFNRNAFTDIDKTKVGNIESFVSNIEIGTPTGSLIPITKTVKNSETGESTNTIYNLNQATSTAAGLMTAEDKVKINNIPVEMVLNLSSQIDGDRLTFQVPANVNNPNLFYNGLRQINSEHYSIEGTVLTLNFDASETPKIGDNLLLTYTELSN